jgi:hypothetical protein
MRPETDQTTPAARRAYRIPDFCRTYGVGRSRAYLEIQAGRLRVRKVGRCTLIAAEDAEAWLACLSRAETA